MQVGTHLQSASPDMFATEQTFNRIGETSCKGEHFPEKIHMEQVLGARDWYLHLGFKGNSE